MEEYRVCTKCGKSKPIDDYILSTRSKDGRVRQCKECRTKNWLKWHDRNREESTARMIAWRVRDRGKQPGKYLWISAKRRAAKYGIPFTIPVEDVVVPELCPVLGIPLSLSNNHAKMDSPSIDRLIPELGYVPGNIAVISLRANSMKNCGTLAEHEKLITWMRKTFGNINQDLPNLQFHQHFTSRQSLYFSRLFCYNNISLLLKLIRTP